MPESKHIIDYISDYWVLLAFGASFFAGYLELKWNVRDQSKRIKEVKDDVDKMAGSVRDAIGDLKSDIREDQREMRDDIKNILLHVGGDKK